MIVNAVVILVKAEHVQDFITATVKNNQGTRKEPGNCCFDVLQSSDDPSPSFSTSFALRRRT